MTGRFARQQIELRTNAFWRRHWRWAVPGVVVACALAGAVGFLIPISLPMWVVYPVVVLAVLSAMRPYFYGTYHLEMGAEAEAWSSTALKKAAGARWQVIDGVSFAYHDVDHVLVGPGGVYAIETKYTDSSIDLDTRRGWERAARWTDQAVEGARTIRLFLRGHGAPDVYAGVIVWGSEMLGTPRFVEGVPIVQACDLGQPFTPWARGVEVLTDLQVEVIACELRRFRAERLRHDRAARAAQAA